MNYEHLVSAIPWQCQLFAACVVRDVKEKLEDSQYRYVNGAWIENEEDGEVLFEQLPVHDAPELEDRVQRIRLKAQEVDSEAVMFVLELPGLPRRLYFGIETHVGCYSVTLKADRKGGRVCRLRGSKFELRKEIFECKSALRTPFNQLLPAATKKGQYLQPPFAVPPWVNGPSGRPPKSLRFFE
jgi:Rieske Fe-S protein